MELINTFSFLSMLLIFVSYPSQVNGANQSQFFVLMKSSLSGNALSDWDVTGGKPYCNFTGISCKDGGYVEKIDMSGWSVSGHFPDDICSYLPQLRVLDLSHNDQLGGNFINSIGNCALLEELNLSSMCLRAQLPDFSKMKLLRILDISNNRFTGDFPMSITNLTDLEVINFDKNGELNPWELPDNISRLPRLRVMSFVTCPLHGRIPPSIGNMTSLVDLELQNNFLWGQIPAELGKMQNLHMLELYFNYLSGTIPDELGNMTELTDLDMSGNSLTGSIPGSICRLPKLQVLHLYENNLTGEIPTSIADSTTLTMLSLYGNFLTGQVPRNLGRSSSMIGLDLSENRLSGPLPPEICRGGKLQYFLVLKNMLSGQIPRNYANCKTLLRFRVSNNSLSGVLPSGIWGLPNVNIIDIQYNQIEGEMTSDIRNAKALHRLTIGYNKLSGELPKEISQAATLVAVELNHNQFFGRIPETVGELKQLNSLKLQNNKLSGSIPDSLGSCVSLSDINMADNSLSGEIPSSLGSLLTLNSLNLSGNELSGHVPESLSSLRLSLVDLSNNKLTGCIPQSMLDEAYNNSFTGNIGLCSKTVSSFPRCPPNSGISKDVRVLIVCLALGSVILFVSLECFLCQRKREKNHKHSLKEESWDVKSFDVLTFSEDEILDSIKQDNLIGKGSSGNVYRVVLSNGLELAVKHIWNMDSNGRKHLRSTTPILRKPAGKSKEFDAEVRTLSSLRHVNVVKLYCSITSEDSSLLVYEYLPNGSLWDRLHNSFLLDLDWKTRYKIGLGAAKGLEYLHHGCERPVIHRDIKSSNILLDEFLNPRIADFGLAKIVQANSGLDSSHVIAGTHGYIAPEYRYTYKVNEKSDVYSFGVVLMELVTRKKPIEPGYGESNDIVHWVYSKIKTKGSILSIVDPKIPSAFKEDAIKVLRISIFCTERLPELRPPMKCVVQMLEGVNQIDQHRH